MSSSHTTNRRQEKPTARQLRALRSLASSRGQSFAYPKTLRQANVEIRRLLRQRPLRRNDRLIEAHELRAVTPPPDAARVMPDEVVGYGSHARWAHRSAEGDR